MSTWNRRSPPSVSSSSGIPRNSNKKAMAAKQRTALIDFTNQRGSRRSASSSKPLVPCTTKVVKTKKEASTSTSNHGLSGNVFPSSILVPFSDTSISGTFESIESIATNNSPRSRGIIRKRDIVADTVTVEEIVDIDDNLTDPQFCATIASDIFKYLLESEVNRRPSVEFMETVQKDINAGMRAILIDWLVEVAEEFRLLPETLFLTVNYVDRYLSGNVMKRQRLQLLGVACMMIAAKFEEIYVLDVEEFCYITENTYFKDEVLQMESAVLNHLNFEMTAPTAMCFLRRFCSVAERTSEVPVPPLLLQYLAHYIAELSLLEYSMLGYAPSLIAASATFLTKYILFPSQKPWNSTLRHYSTYQASDLCDCVKLLHHLCCYGNGPNLAAVREKYCQQKYKFVAKKYCPTSIPPEFFHDLSN